MLGCEKEGSISGQFWNFTKLRRVKDSPILTLFFFFLTSKGPDSAT